MQTNLVCLLALVTVSIAAVVPAEFNALECIVCKETVKKVETKIDNEGKAIGEHEVNVICHDVVPYASAEHLCESYGDKEIDTIVDGIANKEQPKAICQKLGKC